MKFACLVLILFLSHSPFARSDSELKITPTDLAGGSPDASLFLKDGSMIIAKIQGFSEVLDSVPLKIERYDSNHLLDQRFHLETQAWIKPLSLKLGEYFRIRELLEEETCYRLTGTRVDSKGSELWTIRMKKDGTRVETSQIQLDVSDWVFGRAGGALWISGLDHKNHPGLRRIEPDLNQVRREPIPSILCENGAHPKHLYLNRIIGGEDDLLLIAALSGCGPESDSFQWCVSRWNPKTHELHSYFTEKTITLATRAQDQSVWVGFEDRLPTAIGLIHLSSRMTRIDESRVPLLAGESEIIKIEDLKDLGDGGVYLSASAPISLKGSMVFRASQMRAGMHWAPVRTIQDSKLTRILGLHDGFLMGTGMTEMKPSHPSAVFRVKITEINDL